MELSKLRAHCRRCQISVAPKKCVTVLVASNPFLRFLTGTVVDKLLLQTVVAGSGWSISLCCVRCLFHGVARHLYSAGNLHSSARVRSNVIILMLSRRWVDNSLQLGMAYAHANAMELDVVYGIVLFVARSWHGNVPVLLNVLSAHVRSNFELLLDVDNELNGFWRQIRSGANLVQRFLRRLLDWRRAAMRGR